MKNYIKGIITGIIIGAAVCSTSVFASDNISVILDGEKIAFDVQPQIIEERTFVPMRAVFEAFDMTVDWNGETQTVTANRDNNSITMTIGTDTFYHNGEAIELDVPAQIVGDRTLVPVRAISESLDCTVKWDGDERKVIIISSPEKITGTATINEMRCLIDYQPIDFVNVDGFTYIKATDLEDYGFDVKEENGNIYVSRNKTKLPLLIDKYKNGLIDELWFNAPVYPHVNYCHSIMHLWKEPQYGKEFDIFEAKSNVFLDGTQCNAKNINGDMYLQADELQKYGSVTWTNASEWNPYVLSGDVLDVHVATDDLKNQVSEDAGEYAIFNGKDRYGVTRGIVEYKNDKINGMGYISNYYIEIPRGNIYQAGEFDDGNLKNGIIISNVPEANGDYIALYEVNDFEKTQLYPKENIQ